MAKTVTFRELAFFAVWLAVAAPYISASSQPTKTGGKATVVAAVAPTYPGIALAMSKGGKVVVQVSIGPAGRVDGARVVTGAAPLLNPAVTAARLWRFRPGDTGKRAELTFLFRVMPKGTPAGEMTPVFKPPYGVEVRRVMPEPVINYGR